MVNGGNKFCTLSLGKLSPVECTLLYSNPLISRQRRHYITLCVCATHTHKRRRHNGSLVSSSQGSSKRVGHPLGWGRYRTELTAGGGRSHIRDGCSPAGWAWLSGWQPCCQGLCVSSVTTSTHIVHSSMTSRGCSLFGRFSVSTVGLEPSEKTTTKL